MDICCVISAAHTGCVIANRIVWHFILVVNTHLGLITASREMVSSLDRIFFFIHSFLCNEVILGDRETIRAVLKVAYRVCSALVKFVVIAYCFSIVRLEQRALLGLSFLVKVTVSDGHEAGV